MRRLIIQQNNQVIAELEPIDQIGTTINDDDIQLAQNVALKLQAEGKIQTGLFELILDHANNSYCDSLTLPC